MAQPKVPPMPQAPEAVFRPGFIIVKTTAARGGVQYDRQTVNITQHRDGSEEKRLMTDIRRDNAKVIKDSDALVKKCDYAYKKFCTNTVFGWYADQAALSGLEEEFVKLREEADKINRVAKEVGSARRVHVGYVAAKLVLDEYAAREIATTIVAALGRFIEALRAGDVRDVKVDGRVVKRDQVRAAEIASGNLAKLAHGIPAQILQMAIDAVRPAKAEVIRLIDQGLTPEAAGKQVDLGAIENALFYFEQRLY